MKQAKQLTTETKNSTKNNEWNAETVKSIQRKTIIETCKLNCSYIIENVNKLNDEKLSSDDTTALNDLKNSLIQIIDIL